MSDRWVLARDPREGEYDPDASREDWCEEHGQRWSTCGACHAVTPLPSLDDLPLALEARAALAGMSTDRLRHLADADEDTGAGLAARWRRNHESK